MLDSFSIGGSKMIYIIEVEQGPGVSGYFLKCYNLSDKSCSKSNLRIDNNWTKKGELGFDPKYTLTKEPLYGAVDINNDGIQEIFVKERTHNGTTYNASLIRYFEILNDGKFNQILVHEDKTVHPIENCLIERIIGKNYIVEVKSKCFDGRKPEDVGSYRITWTGNTPIIISKKIFIEFYGELLITGSDTPDSIFLRQGY
ncbi:MAG: hypothetical protein WBA17_17080 [Saprospiraceae bacterium]